jgi:hypothetical protein
VFEKVKNSQWKNFLAICRRLLGKGDWDSLTSDSWCAFTTFSSLSHGIYYWNCGFPDEVELLENCTVDGGLWRQSFRYEDLAHIVIPKCFYWEGFFDGKFSTGYKSQNLEKLSNELDAHGIVYRKTELVLEIKVY